MGVLARLLNRKFEMPPVKVEKEKVCPPHKWEWEDQIGCPGVNFVRCQICRRLPGWDDKV